MGASLEMTTDAQVSMVCPTCSAQQSWSDQCRRCKCDLKGLYSVWRSGRRARLECLRNLRSAKLDDALHAAQRFAALLPGDDAIRLLTVCYLLRGDWEKTLQIATVDDQHPASRVR